MTLLTAQDIKQTALLYARQVFDKHHANASLSKCIEISLQDHNDMIEHATYVNDDDVAYFVISENDTSHLAFICATCLDSDNEASYFEICMCAQHATLDEARDYVVAQYRIDTDSV